MNAPNPSWRILIVEDEALLAEELRDRLTGLGHEVVSIVDTGEEAIRASVQLLPDLIMMDIRIKGPINGIQAGDKIYNELGIPVVFASAHSDKDTLQQAQIPGQFGYIIKPFREQDIVMAIRLAMHRHDTEADLQKSHLTYSAILSNIADSIVVINPDGQVRFMNAAAEEMTGWRIDDARDQPVDTVLHLRHENNTPASAKEIQAADMDITATWEGAPYVLVNRTGIETHVRIVATPVRGHREQTLGAAVLIRNVTGRRNIDMCIQHLIDASPDAVVISDDSGRISLANQRAEAAFGYTRDELHAKPLEMLVAERFRADYRSMRDRHLTDPGSRQNDGLREIFGVRKDGIEFPIEITVSSVNTGDGLSIFYVIKNLSSRRSGGEDNWSLENFDVLTGLPNRTQFRERLGWSVAHTGDEKSVVLIVLDVDDFAEVGAALDGDTRDRLIRAIAQRVQRLVREKDALARVSDAQFAIIVPNLYDLRIADRMAQRLIHKLAAPFDVSGQPLQLTASVGIAAHPSDAKTLDELLEHALQSARTARAQGGNRFVHFSPTRQHEAEKWRALLDDLRGALARKEFLLHYQPLVALSTGRPVKIEAILQWKHPRHGFISPFEFHPLLEESGLIHEVGAWMFDEAIAFAAHLEKKLGRAVQVGIPITTEQFIAWKTGPVKWSHKLDTTPAQKGRAAIIIKESALVDHPQMAKEHLPEFRARGIEISIDGFGTRFSSLSHLKLFDFDYLRVDASFVKNIERDENDRALAEAIIVIAHELGASAIGKGVETEKQRELLIGMGCDFAQGALFAKSMPAEEVETLLVRKGGDGGRVKKAHAP